MVFLKENKRQQDLSSKGIYSLMKKLGWYNYSQDFNKACEWKLHWAMSLWWHMMGLRDASFAIRAPRDEKPVFYASLLRVCVNTWVKSEPIMMWYVSELFTIPRQNHESLFFSSIKEGIGNEDNCDPFNHHIKHFDNSSFTS